MRLVGLKPPSRGCTPWLWAAGDVISVVSGPSISDQPVVTSVTIRTGGLVWQRNRGGAAAANQIEGAEAEGGTGLPIQDVPPHGLMTPRTEGRRPTSLRREAISFSHRCSRAGETRGALQSTQSDAVCSLS